MNIGPNIEWKRIEIELNKTYWTVYKKARIVNMTFTKAWSEDGLEMYACEYAGDLTKFLERHDEAYKYEVDHMVNSNEIFETELEAVELLLRFREKELKEFESKVERAKENIIFIKEKYESN